MTFYDDDDLFPFPRQQPPVKTSASHPLRVAELPLGGDFGDIGITLCPGKKTTVGLAGPWHRDLDADLDEIKAWGASAVLTLITLAEMAWLQVTGLPRGCNQRGMVWYHLPITDGTPPDARADREWRQFIGPAVRNTLNNGDRVLIHCRGGLGRAGTIAARLLVEMRVMNPEPAIRQVRAVRPGAIETPAQVAHVMAMRRKEEA